MEEMRAAAAGVGELANVPRGTLRLQAKVTDTTGGFKGFLLKAISPFIKKNKPQEPLPVPSAHPG